MLERSLYEPPATHVPAEVQEIEFRTDPPFGTAGTPGTTFALCQIPFVSLTTNAWSLEPPMIDSPPAVQVRTAVQEMSLTSASAPLGPDNFRALPQTPFFSLTTKEPPLLEKSGPPAVQNPALGQVIVTTAAPAPCARARMPGTLIAFPQTPFFSSTRNAWGLLLLSRK